MANGNRKEFLNVGILGSGASVPEKRGFRRIPTQYIGSPEYDARFFETFPTAWANAYAFSKSLDSGAQEDIEEWASLFLLHFFGTIHLTSYEETVVRNNYDKDLWLALSGTFPDAGTGTLHSVELLNTAQNTVVGSYYPEIVFFPSRGRESWENDTILKDLLTANNRLSWAKCRRYLITNDKYAYDFQMHLRRIVKLLPRQTSQARLDAFCDDQFNEKLEAQGPLLSHPLMWDIPGNKAPKEEELLQRYPLRKPNKKGGQIYFLLQGMDKDLSPWMTTPLLGGPTPFQYRKKDENKIEVQFAGRTLVCQLESEKDQIVLLKDLLLSESPYWCKIPRTTDTSKIRPLHRIELHDSVLTQDDVAVCLAPLTAACLGYFPELMQNFKGMSALPSQGGLVTWTFMFPGVSTPLEVKWQTKPIGSLEMPNTSLALWPPKVSRRWKLYVVFGRGYKETSGRWHLIDENGWQGTTVELDDPANSAEYVSILQRPGETPNKPRALLFTDNVERERGILLLADLGEHAISKEEYATLAVDFGTSNTCMAYSGEGQGEILEFQLSPEMLWGQKPAVESLGFAPFKWSLGKGFFPSILVSRIGDDKLPDLAPEEVLLEHLFKVDVPGLHKGIEALLFASGGGLNQIWRIHPNLKWDPNPKTPWRSLFLELTLLYAHAEMFFNKNAIVNKYIFTYPLALPNREVDRFHDRAQMAIDKIRRYCYRIDPQLANPEYIDSIDESTAIAGFIRTSSNPGSMEVFVDVGGGTADIAIRHDKRFLVLDSIRVAGNTFFRIAEKNFTQKLKGASQFKKNLKMLLEGRDNEMDLPSSDLQIDLGTYYSVYINQVSNTDFRNREEAILKKGMGADSYQKYRTRLFLRHIIAYALMQACAVVVDQRILLNEGIKLILGGNAWGLMVFAEFARERVKLEEEAREILKLLQKFLTGVVKADERKYLAKLHIFNIELLNEKNLSRAKIAVALGALEANPERLGKSKTTSPYSGLTVNKLAVNNFKPTTIRWCDRWGFENFKERFGMMDQINNANFSKPENLRQPLDPALTVFTCLGNAGRIDQDIMPAETWNNINGEVIENIDYLKGDRIEFSPINHFISQILYPEKAQRDFLDILAEKNGNFKTSPSED
jgi:hypothetical protein